MKIIIVGAGISGLGFAIALKKYIFERQAEAVKEKLQIKIYDKPDTSLPDTPLTHLAPNIPDRAKSADNLRKTEQRLKNQGAAVSLQQNALDVLLDIDPDLARQVMEAGHVCSHFTWKTAGNWLLGRRWFDVILPISRPILIQVLMDKLLNGHGTSVEIRYNSVVGVRIGERQKPVVAFEDGVQEEADLVVGADGIHSMVRKSLFSAQSRGGNENFKPQYLGQCGVGGILQHSIGESHWAENSAITFIIDSSGVFGYCPVNQTDKGRILYFSFYDSELPPRGTKADRQAISAQLRHRHANCADPVVRECVSSAQLDNIWPTFYMPDLPNWGANGVVLVGDAAHAMPPSTGQGGSQALEDGQTLALLLASFLERQSKQDVEALPSAIESAIQGFYNVRHERVERIKAEALRLREPPRPWSWTTKFTMFFGLWLMMKIESVRGLLGYRDAIFDWNVHREVEAHMTSL